MSIRLINISKRYGNQVVVNNLSLEIHDGEFFVLLGPSGSGKTTVLNIIAGLTETNQGQVFLHNRDVTFLPTQNRKVGFVFQNYALFQHMNVAENIEFGLRVRKISRTERQRKRDEVLELVGLVGLEDRMPFQLSGGQQQRVALARALVIEPEVLLLDEPLGALDAKIRVELRRSLKMIQQQLGVATILVTHDQEEAFDLGDRIGVMSFGRLVEVDTPQELYQHPKTEFVASFLGAANLLVAQVNGSTADIGEHAFPLPFEATKLISDGRAQILFRPEDVVLAANPDDLDCFPLGEGKVVEIDFSGPTERLRLELPVIPGVRSIAPAIPYGNAGIILEASRPPDQCAHLPILTGNKTWVGIRRLHALSHPGMHFLLITDASPRSQAALGLGGYLAQMAHAQVTLLGLGRDDDHLRNHLQNARKQLGAGMASVQSKISSEPLLQAVSKVAEGELLDLAVIGWEAGTDLSIPEQVLQAGSHHLLLAAAAEPRLAKALIAVASGEPGKEDVLFAGRLLRHLGAEATLMTSCPQEGAEPEILNRSERFLENGLYSLARFGVTAQSRIRINDPVSAILDELESEVYDLVVLGAPLPDLRGRISLDGIIGEILNSTKKCSFLIVRSHQNRTF